MSHVRQGQLSLHDQLLEDASHRFGALSFVFAFGFSLYGFASFETLVEFDRGLALWDNVWPRLMLNSLPYLLLGFFARNKSFSPRLRCVVLSILIPFIFSLACMIHAWPIMWKGQVQLYSLLHGANVFVMTIALISVSPPLAVLRMFLGCFCLFFVLPVIAILVRNGDKSLIQLFVGDMTIFLPVIYVTARSIHILRENLEKSQREIKESITPFLGHYLAKALYEKQHEMLKDRKENGILMSMDIRNSSEILRTLNDDAAKQLMQRYQERLVAILSECGAHLHKSMGDGHLISFGLLDVPNLSDIPSLREENEKSEAARITHYSARALRVHEKMSTSFAELLDEFGLDDSKEIGLVTAVAYGEVSISVTGDSKHRQELDLAGQVVVKSARLEQHSKLLRALHPEWKSRYHGLIIVAPELIADFERIPRSWASFETVGNQQVRDFPEVERILVCAHVPNRLISGRPAA